MPAYSFNWFGLYHTVQIYLYESSLFRNIYFFQFTINCPRGCKIAIQLRGNSVRPPNATCTCLMKNLSLLFLKKINTTLLYFHFRSNLLIITYVRTWTCDPLLFICIYLAKIHIHHLLHYVNWYSDNQDKIWYFVRKTKTKTKQLWSMKIVKFLVYILFINKTVPP